MDEEHHQLLVRLLRRPRSRIDHWTKRYLQIYESKQEDFHSDVQSNRTTDVWNRLERQRLITLLASLSLSLC